MGRVARVVLAVALAALPLRATAEILQIDRFQSEATISGTISFDLASGALVLPVGPQATGGAILPSGMLSDGLTTFFHGSVEVEYDTTVTPKIRFRAAGSRVEVGNSGSWLPGLPGTSETPAAANAGVTFSDPDFGISGTGALRDVRFTLTSLELPLTETGTGTNVYEFDSSVFLRLTGGDRDLDTNLVASLPRRPLSGPLAPSLASTGTLELLPQTPPRLTLPIAATNLVIGQEALTATFTASLTGQIVATVPEPSGALCGWAALGSLVVLRRMRGRR